MIGSPFRAAHMYEMGGVLNFRTQRMSEPKSMPITPRANTTNMVLKNELGLS